MERPRLIINADGFGFTPAINRGIRLVAAAGTISSISVTPNFPASAELAEFHRLFPRISVGVHLNPVVGRPVSACSSVPTLVNRDGFFWYTEFPRRLVRGLIDRRELFAELPGADRCRFRHGRSRDAPRQPSEPASPSTVLFRLSRSGNGEKYQADEMPPPLCLCEAPAQWGEYARVLRCPAADVPGASLCPVPHGPREEERDADGGQTPFRPVAGRRQGPSRLLANRLLRSPTAPARYTATPVSPTTR